MKLLYVAVESLYPVNTGSRIRAYQLVKALASKHEIGIAYISSEEMGDNPDAMYVYARQIPLRTPLSQLSSWQKLQYLTQGVALHTFPLSRFFLGPQQMRMILQLIEMEQPDAVILQTTYILPLGKVIKLRYPNIKVILDAHNVESRLQDRMARSSSSRLMRLVKRYLAGNLERIERSAHHYIDAIAAVSEEEMNWFKQACPGVVVKLVPNGVDIDFFRTESTLPQAPVIAFCGSMSYLPNHEGAIWFAEEVWPNILARTSEARWLIIGKDPPLDVQRLANDRITVTGTVDDVRTWIEKSRLSVVPPLSGAGTRLKILEAMAMERVVVSTELGAEGILANPGIIRVDNPSIMANRIVDLLLADNLEELGRQNRKAVVRHYSWQAIGTTMMELIEQLD